jgi:hypothetical protein
MHIYQGTADIFGLSQRPKNKVNSFGQEDAHDELENQNRKDAIKGIISRPNAFGHNG